MLVEAGNRGNILDYTVWSPGTSGAVTGFSVNGAALENYRVIDTGPQGSKITVWEARPDSSGNADGGWNTNSIPIDNTKMYRFSVWIRRTVQGNGTAYLGLNGYGSVAGVYTRSSGSSNTNPYFFTSSTPSPTTGEWVLWVGHVWPKGSGAGDQHPDSGRYTVENGRIGNISQDFIWREETTTVRHRSYLYYATDTSTRQQFCYPRVDLCDGSEPTIEDLLSGIDERWEGEEFPTTTSIRENIVTPNSSEVGITRGLVAWYPLIGDTKDYAGTNHASNNGAVATAEGYEFNGTTDYLLIEPTTVDASVDFTLSFWVYPRGTSTYTLYCARTTTGNGLSIFGINGKIRFDLGSQWATTVAPPLDEWSHVTVSREGDSKFIFFNGVLVASTSIGTLTNFNPNLSTVGASQINGSTYANYIDGFIRDFRSFDKALSEEEVAILYNLTTPTGSKMVMTQSCLYTKGQIKEVIA